MKVYVFGNEDLFKDNLAIKVAQELENKIKNVKFIYPKPNQDIPIEKHLIIMDVVKGIDEVRVLDDKYIDKLKNIPRYSAHDFDLGFQLKYLKKLGKIGKVTIIGLPVDGSKDLVIVSSNKLLKEIQLKSGDYHR